MGTAWVRLVCRAVKDSTKDDVPGDGTAALAAWACDVRWSALTEDERARVLDTLIDTVGVALVGSRSAELASVLEAADRLGWTVPGIVEQWGNRARLSAPAAALLNATAAHVLDFDDVHHVLHGHPSAVLWPALVAVAQEDRLAGTRVLEGYVAGVGVMTAVARLFGPRHYSLGWHATSTIGAIGAAAGVAVALGLTEDGVGAAIGTAVSMASGVRASFGTVLKPLHAGLAARSAVEAARLAQAGVRPAATALTGPLGGLDVFGDGSWTAPPEHTGVALVAVAQAGLDDLGLKPYPACRGAHYAIDAAREVREQLTGAAVEQVRVDVPLGARTALLHDDPADGLQARFSLPYAVAVTLAHGAPDLHHFSDEAVRDPQTRALMELLVVHEDDSAGDLSASMTGRYAEVTVRTVDGRTVTSRVSDPRGSRTRPLSSSEVDAKFRRTAGTVLSATEVERVLARLRAEPCDLRFDGLLGTVTPAH